MRLVFLFVVAQLLFSQSPSPAEVERWWKVGEQYMQNLARFRAGSPGEKPRSQGERRKLAEPWLRSAWQNGKDLPGQTRRQIGIRLLQAQIGNTSYPEARDLLTTLEKDPDFQVCRAAAAPADLETEYSCAELWRLAGNLEYTWFSQANLRFEEVETAKCRTLFGKVEGQPTCLEVARQYLLDSQSRFGKIITRLPGVTPSALIPLCRNLNPETSCTGELVRLAVAERRDQAAMNEGLALQESGQAEAALVLFEGLKPFDPKSPLSAALRPTVALHLVRTLRDLGKPKESEAVQRIRELLASSQSALVRWRAELVSATLQLRAGSAPEALKTLQRAFDSREKILQDAVNGVGLLDLDSSLAESANSDDVFLSLLLGIQDPRLKPEKSRLLRHYCAAIYGSGDFAVRRLFESLRSPQFQDLHRSLAQTLNSGQEDWDFGTLVSARRRAAFEDLEKLLAAKLTFPLRLEPASAVWDQFWRSPAMRAGELVVILQYRPYRVNQPTAQAMQPLEYLLLDFEGPNQLRIAPLGNAEQLDDQIKALRESATGRPNGSLIRSLSRALGFAPGPKPTSLRRMMIMAGGQWQQFPWALAQDRQGGSLIDSRSFVQLNSMREVTTWTALPSRAPQRAIAVPDLTPLKPTLGSGGLGQLAARGWEKAEVDAAQASVTAFAAWGKAGAVATNVFLDKQATEEALSLSVSPANLYLFSHGDYLSNALGVSLWDRGVLLLAPQAPRDGVLLSSEAKMLRLQATRLAFLAACRAGSAGALRNEPLEGLRSSFHVAGVRTVIAPIWNVEVVPTAQLAEKFFGKSGELDLALRAAQLELRKANAPTRGWAGWMISGDPSAP